VSVAAATSLLVSQQGFLFHEVFAAVIAPQTVQSPVGPVVPVVAASGGAAGLSPQLRSLTLQAPLLGAPGALLQPSPAFLRPETAASPMSAGALKSPDARGAAPAAVVAPGPADTALPARPAGLAAQPRVGSGSPALSRHSSAGPVRKAAVQVRSHPALVPASGQAPASPKDAASPKAALARLGRTLVSGASPAAAVSALRWFFDGAATAPKAPEAALPGEAAGRAASASGRRSVPGLSPAESSGRDSGGRPTRTYDRLKELKQVLGDGAAGIEPFVFRGPRGVTQKARSAGLEGFLFSKLEFERAFGEEARASRIQDYFAYLGALLGALPWTEPLKREVQALQASQSAPAEKNRLLTGLLARVVGDLQAEHDSINEARWGRGAHTYSILTRAYNRLKPGKNFFDSLDDDEIRRIRDELHADQIWLLDVFEIGDVRRWGTGGGSPYAIKGYNRMKPELGGEAAFRRFVDRAHRLGVKVRTDYIPNHTSLDSDLLRDHPEGLVHILPPQGLSDEQIWAGVPREQNSFASPFFELVKSRNYPGREGEETKLLVIHPLSDFGLWMDMGQIDYSRTSARDWMVEQALHLFGEKGIDSARRDMAYYEVNAMYPGHVLRGLEAARAVSHGWARDGIEKTIREFRGRWAELNGEEFLGRLTDAVKRAHPSAVFDDEAYTHFTDLSRVGSDGVYGKNTHDESMGQVGLYDALKSRDAGWIRAALRNNAFRFWQRGGASTVNFVGNHDETNPVNVFGWHLRAAAGMALLGGPIVTYNGFELGTDQRTMLGDLKGSEDRNKAIPFDIPVSIDWSKTDPDTARFVQRILAKHAEYKGLFREGVMDVPEPVSGTPVVAYTVGRRDDPASRGPKAILVAANFGGGRSWGQFRMGAPLLEAYGAFKPRADRTYLFRDVAHQSPDGSPVIYSRTGEQLLKEGLYLVLDAGDVHIFEIEEMDPAAPTEGTSVQPHFDQLLGEGLRYSVSGSAGAASLARAAWAAGFSRSGRAPAVRAALGAEQASKSVPGLSSVGSRRKGFFAASWDEWTRRLTDASIIAFLPLQLPQIVKNIGYLLAGQVAPMAVLPWMGYSTGILANLLLLSWFTSQKEPSAARVQAVGVVTSGVVLGQLFLAGFMPAAAFFTVMPVIATGLTLSFLNAKGRLPPRVWDTWNRLSSVAGLAALPLVFASTFFPQSTLGPAAAVAGLLGLGMSEFQRRGWLPKPLENLWNNMSAWTATWLFMFGPIAQLVSNLSNPASMAGISLTTLFLATAGNAMMLPRAFKTKNKIWTAGSLYAVLVGGWGVMLSMLSYGFLSPVLVLGFTAFLAVYLPYIIWKAKKTNGDPSIKAALGFLAKV